MDLEALKLVRHFFADSIILLCEGQRYALQSKCLLEISGCTYAPKNIKEEHNLIDKCTRGSLFSREPLSPYRDVNVPTLTVEFCN